jgi:hypothetical protein
VETAILNTGHTHSVAKLVMSDKQMAMSPSTFSKLVMLRHSKLAIAALKEMYKDEAQHVALHSP